MARKNYDNVGSRRYYERLKPIITESGKVYYEAPVKIETEEDLKFFNISWRDCTTLHFGCSSLKQTVYFLRVEDKEMAELYWREVNSEHSRKYREERCLIPGKQSPLIACPDSNRCAQCPFPMYRDKRKANNISLDVHMEAGGDFADSDKDMRAAEARIELEKVCKTISQKNPKYTQAIILKEYYGLSVKEIAKRMDDTERNIRFYMDEAKKTGKKYKAKHYSDGESFMC